VIGKLRHPATVVCGVAGILVGIAILSVASAQAHGSARATLARPCAYADAPVTGAPAPVLRSAVVCLINEQREARGLPALLASERLNNIAQRHTHAMVATGTFSHGSDFVSRFTDGGYDWRAAGENIASGYATPRSVVDAWMASRDHCQNILSPMFRNVGTGVAVQGVGTGVGPGTWTEDFGVLMQQSFPSSNTRPRDGCPYR
jgi:uncharacterized protein YkwD